MALERLRAGASTLAIGPEAYFDAICEVLLGENQVPPHGGRAPAAHTWTRIANALTPEIQTYVENQDRGPTFSFRGHPLPLVDKAAFYAASDVTHWWHCPDGAQTPI